MMTAKITQDSDDISQNPSVFTVILNFNNYSDTLETIASVYASDYDANTLILIENSTDEQITHNIRLRFPSLEIIQNSENLGYAGGNNVGVQEAIDRGAEYIFILNNDVILEKDVITKCIDALRQSPNCAACQPLISFDNDRKKIWSAGTQLFFGYPRLFLKGQSIIRNGAVKPPFGLVGCAIFFRVSALRDVGLFDASLFLMHEETDWCIRAKKRKFSLLVITSAVAYHKISATIGLLSREYLYYVGRNWLLVGRKNYDILNYGYILITEMTIRFPYYLYHLAKRGQINQIKYYLKGIIDGIRGVSGKADF
ncbi:glycosyltransferase family 2 protein [Methanoregula sp.]|uniref:glycosyltransferase family 2 protein n=1 Tax=Methanoregula sp. TaxID=2052170 RepID=UPI003C7340DE